jgi:hypothetical protein
MKIVTYTGMLSNNKKPDWADMVFRIPSVDLKTALVTVIHIDDDVLLLRYDVDVLNKDDVIRFFKSFKKSAVVKYGDEVIGYFISRNDKQVKPVSMTQMKSDNSPTLVLTHYALKV